MLPKLSENETQYTDVTNFVRHQISQSILENAVRCTGELQRLFYRVDEVRRATAMSRADLYRRVASGEIRSVRIGRSIRIPAQAIQQWIEELNRNAD